MSPKSKAAAKSKAAQADPIGADKPVVSPNVATTVVTPPLEKLPQVSIFDTLATYTGKPDSAVYNSEQDRLKKDIEQSTKTLNALKEKISSATRAGPNADRRNELKAELDNIRSQQGDVKQQRDTILAQIKSIQEGLQKRTSDLQSKKSSSQFKSVADIDAQIRNLESQVESGSLTVLAEKRALQDISGLKRQRKALDGLQGSQDSIESERAKLDELRAQLDNPEAKARSERFDAIKEQLDSLKRESDDAYASRSTLFEERDTLQQELDDLYSAKRESVQRYRDATKAYGTKQQEERTKRAERSRQLRQAAEDEKKQEMVDRLRDEADTPAFQADIQDCQTLIDFFSGNVTATTNGLELNKAKVQGVPEHNLRTVADNTQGLVPLKVDDQDYFAPTKRSKKRGVPSPKASEPSNVGTADRFSVPLAKLSALANLSIPPPSSASEVQETIENLKRKKEWLIANQERQTAENKAKAEKEITALLRSMSFKDSEMETGNVEPEVLAEVPASST